MPVVILGIGSEGAMAEGRRKAKLKLVGTKLEIEARGLIYHKIFL